MTFKYQIGQSVVAKSSGNLYRVEYQRTDNHPKLRGEIGYDVRGVRYGRLYGPLRVMRESSLSPVVGPEALQVRT